MKLDRDWKPIVKDDYKDVLSTDYRKIIMKETSLNKANLSTLVKKLIEKGCLYKNEEGGTQVNNILMPNIVGDIVEYSFTLDMKGN